MTLAIHTASEAAHIARMHVRAGLAAGFDKHAEVVGPMMDLGFGFVEIGECARELVPGGLRLGTC